MEPRISIITLGVADLKRAINFYQQGLGLPLREDQFDNIAFFELQGTWLGLFPKSALAKDANATSTNSTGFNGITLAHNVRSKLEVDTLLQLAQKAGATIVKAAADADWGGYSGYFTDLDGYYWEIAWNPYF